MFKFIKKEESLEDPVITQSEDWTKEIKRSQKIGQEVEQLSFIYDNNNDNILLGTKQGLSKDHLKILKICKKKPISFEVLHFCIIIFYGLCYTNSGSVEGNSAPRILELAYLMAFTILL